MKYAIVDIETTGSYSHQNGITEIAVVITDGEKVLDTYETLVNPEEDIPGFIQSLTGITNEMVENAPTINEVATELYEILKDKVFVAHRVNFDYSFIKRALSEFDFSARRLCTVRLSKKLILEAPRYGLGKLTHFLSIPHDNPHRAMGDAMATTHLFHHLKKLDKLGIMEKDLKANSGEAVLPLNLSKERFDLLPNSTGVYYFLDQKGKIVYIGKALNIKQRVKQHFSGLPNSRRKHDMHQIVADVKFEVTGSELLSFLLEDSEIRKYWPHFNRAQKNLSRWYGIHHYSDHKDVQRLGINHVKSGQEVIARFPTLWEAKNWLHEKIKEYQLNPEYCGLAQFEESEVTRVKHNSALKKMIKNLMRSEPSFIVLDKGRHLKEKSFVWVEKGNYCGYGFIPKSTPQKNKLAFSAALTMKKESGTARAIINSFIERNYLKIIPLSKKDFLEKSDRREENIFVGF